MIMPGLDYLYFEVLFFGFFGDGFAVVSVRGFCNVHGIYSVCCVHSISNLHLMAFSLGFVFFWFSFLSRIAYMSAKNNEK